jgi:pyruvate/2-oxoglutarate dehydrogenase complex dihydrolipoamide acyltransferase (E2) component
MSSPDTEQLIDVPMPQMGTSITEGELIAWLRKPGDQVEADEALCEISTDKVDSECPSPVSGVLAELLVQEGEVVEVGAVMARIAPTDRTPAKTSDLPGRPTPPDGAPDAPSADVTSSGDGASRRFYSPVARRIAIANDVDLDLISGNGLNGRVTKKDVERFIAGREAEPRLHSDSPYRPDAADRAAPEPGQAGAALGGDPQPLSRMRVAIGSAMRRSLDTAATCHTVVECDVTSLEGQRRELGVTALPLLSCAVVATLRAFPDLNATLSESTITRFERVHLGIAVSLGEEGLIVPVVKDAQTLSVEGMSSRIKDLATRARAKGLGPDEVQGATFTITNPGAFGASIATPIISLPQVAILDLEAVVRRPVVRVGEDGSESIAIRSMVNLVLGWDHRAVDGVYAARFLSAVRDAIQS